MWTIFHAESEKKEVNMVTTVGRIAHKLLLVTMFTVTKPRECCLH